MHACNTASYHPKATTTTANDRGMREDDPLSLENNAHTPRHTHTHTFPIRNNAHLHHHHHPSFIHPLSPPCMASTTQVEVLRFVRFISVLAVATGVLFYAIAVGRGGDPLQMFITCFVVSNPPHLPSPSTVI